MQGRIRPTGAVSRDGRRSGPRPDPRGVAMKTTWSVGGAVAALALLAAAAPAAPAPTESLRHQALALNEITGEDAELGKIFELIEDGVHTKPLLEEAAKMAKDKDQPFNVNATLILART